MKHIKIRITNWINLERPPTIQQLAFDMLIQCASFNKLLNYCHHVFCLFLCDCFRISQGCQISNYRTISNQRSCFIFFKLLNPTQKSQYLIYQTGKLYSFITLSQKLILASVVINLDVWKLGIPHNINTTLGQNQQSSLDNRLMLFIFNLNLQTT